MTNVTYLLGSVCLAIAAFQLNNLMLFGASLWFLIGSLWKLREYYGTAATPASAAKANQDE